MFDVFWWACLVIWCKSVYAEIVAIEPVAHAVTSFSISFTFNCLECTRDYLYNYTACHINTNISGWQLVHLFTVTMFEEKGRH